MPSNRDSSRPGQPGKRRVLRKIEPAGATSTIPPPALPSSLGEPDRDELPLPLQRPATPRAPVTSAIARPSESSPPPGGTYTSVAPVVATVITPLGTTLDPLPQPRRSSLKGVIVGASLGLAIVASFVAGTRLAMRAQAPSPPAAAAAQGPTQPTAPVTLPTAGPAPLAATDVPPVVAATQLPVTPPPPKRGRHAWKSVPKAAAQAEGEPGPGEVASAPKAPAPSAAPASDPAPEDTATSLVPVIPTATAPPPVDPFVKAVQTDIDEDTSKHR